MDYNSGDYSRYPGSDKKALHVDFAALTEAAQLLNVAVTFYSGGLYFSPSRLLINIDTKTPNQCGFVSLGQLSDEYLHAWNQVRGRGKFLEAKAAQEHQALGRTAAARGTKSLGTKQNTVFHKLEALNFIGSDQHVPSFVWRIPCIEMRQFAYSWTQDF